MTVAQLDREVVTRIVDALIAAGYKLTVDYGEGERVIKPTTDRDVIMPHMMQCDEEYLIALPTTAGDGKIASFVRFIYGESGWDVVNDNGESINPIIDPIIDWAEQVEVTRR